MALKLDENYSGSTLLSAWWRQVKNNFTAVKAFVDALETDKANTTDVEKALKNKADTTAVTNALEDKADKAELHKHNNKSILDNITQDTVDNWQKVADAVDDLNKEMAGEYESGLGERINENSDKIGNLDDLPTADKSSIVNAIIALKKLIGSSTGTTGTDAALKVMTDYSLEYAEEGVYAKDPIDNMPLGLYIFSPIQDIEHIFLVSADGESELAVLSEPLYQNNVYILRFGFDSSEIIADFGSSGIDMSEIDETLSVINEDIEELQRKQLSHTTGDLNAYEKMYVENDSVSYVVILDPERTITEGTYLFTPEKAVASVYITAEIDSEGVSIYDDFYSGPGLKLNSGYTYVLKLTDAKNDIGTIEVLGAIPPGTSTSVQTNIIKDSTSTTKEIAVQNNCEYRCGTLTNLSMSLSMPDDDFAAWIAFTSGATATEMIYDSFVKWSGDDVVGNVFTPQTSKRYNIGLWYDGWNMNAVVRGVAI